MVFPAPCRPSSALCSSFAFHYSIDRPHTVPALVQHCHSPCCSSGRHLPLQIPSTGYCRSPFTAEWNNCPCSSGRHPTLLQCSTIVHPYSSASFLPQLPITIIRRCSSPYLQSSSTYVAVPIPGISCSTWSCGHFLISIEEIGWSFVFLLLPAYLFLNDHLILSSSFGLILVFEHWYSFILRLFQMKLASNLFWMKNTFSFVVAESSMHHIFPVFYSDVLMLRKLGKRVF